jgi:hypothetical protein
MWYRILTNKSTTNMICCYVSGQHRHVYLQRGYRNYGTPNVSPFLHRANSFHEWSPYKEIWITISTFKDDAIAHVRTASITTRIHQTIARIYVLILIWNWWRNSIWKVKIISNALVLVSSVHLASSSVRIGILIVCLFVREAHINNQKLLDCLFSYFMYLSLHHQSYHCST